MTKTYPIFRIFDKNKALEFYIDWLGFRILWEHAPEDQTQPAYFAIEKEGIILYLSEHYGDGTPGSSVLIENFPNLKAYHHSLLHPQYKYMRPGLETAFYDENLYSVGVIDPFGNHLTFTGKKED